MTFTLRAFSLTRKSHAKLNQVRSPIGRSDACDALSSNRKHSQSLVQGVNSRSAAVVIAVTLQRLIDHPDRVWTTEQELVLETLRRSRGDLAGASNADLAMYVAGLDPDQLRGVVSNVKGIYHELLFKAAEDADGDQVTAQLQEATNHPGHDVEFIVYDGVIGAVQLKAVASPAHIYEHLARYPGIDILATEEVAAMVEGVSSSGFSNVKLEAEERETFALMPGDRVPQEMLDTAGTSILVSAAFAAREALRAGRVEPRAFRAAMGDLGIGLTTALALDVVLGGA